MLKLQIKELLVAKSIEHPVKWLTGIGISKEVARKLVNNKQVSISKKHIELICLNAFCTPNDLFKWVPDNKGHDVKHHPLQKLRNVILPNLLAEHKQLSVEEMHEYNAAIAEIKKKRKD